MQNFVHVVRDIPLMESPYSITRMRMFALESPYILNVNVHYTFG